MLAIVVAIGYSNSSVVYGGKCHVAVVFIVVVVVTHDVVAVDVESGYILRHAL